jgi:hypothetical protein
LTITLRNLWRLCVDLASTCRYSVIGCPSSSYIFSLLQRHTCK